ncbi:MAG: class I SAM-dependent methyltransferase [Chloroflexota bacterium]
MTDAIAIAAIVAGLVLALFLLARWLLITTEGVFLGRRVVVWLYDLAAHRYDDIKQFDPDSESAFVIWPLRRRLQNPAPLVLDVATGTGRLPYFLLQEPAFNGRVIGLDASEKMLRGAQGKLQGYGERAALVQQSAQDLPFPDGAFDAVTCLEALEFLPDDTAALREMVRVLMPGGVLLVTRRCGPDARFFLDRDRSPEEFEALLSGMGLTEIIIQPWQLEYDLVWAIKPPDIPTPKTRRPSPAAVKNRA